MSRCPDNILSCQCDEWHQAFCAQGIGRVEWLIFWSVFMFECGIESCPSPPICSQWCYAVCALSWDPPSKEEIIAFMDLFYMQWRQPFTILTLVFFFYSKCFVPTLLQICYDIHPSLLISAIDWFYYKWYITDLLLVLHDAVAPCQNATPKYTLTLDIYFLQF